MDENKIIERVKAAWAGAHAGKIKHVSATDDPRRYIVVTSKVFNAPLKALHAHGLTVVGSMVDLGGTGHAVTVFVLDRLWVKLQVDDPSPFADPVSDALELLKQRVPPDLQNALQTLEKAISDLSIQTGDLKLRQGELRRENERLCGASEDDAAHIDELAKIVDAFRAPAQQPETLLVTIPLVGSETRATVLERLLKQGYEVVYEGFTQGTTINWNARLQRREAPPVPTLAPATSATAPIEMMVPSMDPAHSGGSVMDEPIPAEAPQPVLPEPAQA